MGINLSLFSFLRTVFTASSLFRRGNEVYHPVYKYYAVTSIRTLGVTTNEIADMSCLISRGLLLSAPKICHVLLYLFQKRSVLVCSRAGHALFFYFPSDVILVRFLFAFPLFPFHFFSHFTLPWCRLTTRCSLRHISWINNHRHKLCCINGLGRILLVEK